MCVLIECWRKTIRFGQQKLTVRLSFLNSGVRSVLTLTARLCHDFCTFKRALFFCACQRCADNVFAMRFCDAFLRLVKWSSPHEADASDLAGLDRGRDHGLLSRRRGLGRRG